MKSTSIILTTLAVVAAGGAVGAGMVRVAQSDPPYDSRYDNGQRYERSADPRDSRDSRNRRHALPANTAFNVRLDSRVSTEDMHAGDIWSGHVEQDVVSHRRVQIPAGSPVRGVVTAAAQGTHETPAQLSLAVTEVSVEGDRQSLNANTEPIVAGSNRAKKLGAIAGGALVGEVVGHHISHEHGGLIGGLLGGAIGYRATQHAFRTLQLQPGTVVMFTTTETADLNAYGGY